MSGQLFLVATPIGNLGDITLRALETLKNADIIACEDTRHTLALLNKYEIKKPLISYYKQKEQEGSERITELLDEGKNVALVSDAGMPCISDPGSVLVAKLLERGYKYTIIPGASAVVSAVALTGVTGSFTFIGFLPEKTKETEKCLSPYINVNTNLIVYSAPHDVNDTLESLYKILGDRKVYIVKEITKIHESVTVGTLSTMRVETPKGEYVLVIESKTVETVEVSSEMISQELATLINGGIDKKTAIKTITEKYNISKNIVYKLSIGI